MRLAQQILQVDLVRGRRARENPAVEHTTAEWAAQWPVVDEIRSKKREEYLEFQVAPGSSSPGFVFEHPRSKRTVGWPPALTNSTAAGRDPSGIVTRPTRTHQLTPGGAASRKQRHSRPTMGIPLYGGCEGERKHPNTTTYPPCSDCKCRNTGVHILG